MILVTGGEGLIGAALRDGLTQRGVACVGSSRRPHPGSVHLDLASVDEAVLPAGLTTAVLCAWQGGVAECAADPAATRAVNVAGNLALITRLRAAGANIMFLSTSLVFSGPGHAPASPTSPCCEYAKQKCEVEAALDPRRDAIIRVTKVGETLLPRLRAWAQDLRAGNAVQASEALRVAPVMLKEVAAGLGWLAEHFQPGIFQMSARHDSSYFEVAQKLAARLPFAAETLVANRSAGVQLFHPLPSTGALEWASPEGCPVWPDGGDALQLLVETAIS